MNFIKCILFFLNQKHEGLAAIVLYLHFFLISHFWPKLLKGNILEKQIHLSE